MQAKLLRFIQEHHIQEHHVKVLNIAGPRASKEPEVYGFVMDVLGKALRNA